MGNKAQTIAEILLKLSDQELIELLPYIRDENGERMSLIELKHYLREQILADQKRREQIKEWVRDRLVDCKECEYHFYYRFENEEELHELCYPSLDAISRAALEQFADEKGKLLAWLVYAGRGLKPHKGCLNGKRRNDEMNGVWIIKKKGETEK